MTSRVQRFIGSIVALVMLAALLVACAGGGTGSGGTQFSSDVVAQQVVVAADPSGALRWDKQEYAAQAGDVTFAVKNPSQIIHQFSVEGAGVDYRSPNLRPGSTNNFTIKNLPAGEYQIVCNYPGHKVGGMIAELVVQP
jgi:uncharacterized cupredoxin-like copper-binding protein